MTEPERSNQILIILHFIFWLQRVETYVYGLRGILPRTNPTYGIMRLRTFME